MDTINFIVKDGSTQEFFKERLIGFNAERDLNHRGCHGSMNDYLYMKDVILIKKDEKLESKKSVLFILSDEALGSRRKLQNRYLYSVESYDSVSTQLTLVDFSVALIL